MSPNDDTPPLSTVPDPDEPAAEPAAPPPPPKPGISLASQIRNYATLIVDLKKQTHLGEGTLTRLVELALNERFTLIQMGLARPNSAPAIEDQHDSEDNADSGEGIQP